MKRKQGFTLVELLVVMAIIAILAAIVVPNVQKYITRARVTRAISEIKGIELAMTAMLTDAGRGSLSQLFRPGAVPTNFGWNPGTMQASTWPTWITAPSTVVDPVTSMTLSRFEAISQMYRDAVYDLLRFGRNVLRGDGDLSPAVFTTICKKETLAKLGENYMDIGNDPWGNRYNIFPGPWRIDVKKNGTNVIKEPIMFRKFAGETNANGVQTGRKDAYMLNQTALSTYFASVVEDTSTWPTVVGCPADTTKSLYIWSYGENMRNGQMVYQASYAGDPSTWYNVQEQGDIGGGDDINNWDPDTSWQRFYN